MLVALAVIVGLIVQAPLEGHRPPADPLLGRWVLEPNRSRYGLEDRRPKREVFECVARGGRAECAIQRTFDDGRTVAARFDLAYDGTAQRVIGLPDVDEVRLRRVSDAIVDATFSGGGRAVVAYRVLVSEDRRHLIIISVEPISRAVLQSVVVYRRE